MTTTDTGIDLAAVKERQRWTWAGGDYGAIAARIVPMAGRTVESANLRASDTVLDVATGTGNAAIAAARRGPTRPALHRDGPRCSATGVDYVQALLERGRERGATEGLNVTFTEADAEDLPYSDASFDAVLSCVGVMFTPDHGAGRGRARARLPARRREDLATLATRHDRQPSPAIAVPSEYREAIAVRAS